MSEDKKKFFTIDRIVGLLTILAMVGFWIFTYLSYFSKVDTMYEYLQDYMGNKDTLSSRFDAINKWLKENEEELKKINKDFDNHEAFTYGINNRLSSIENGVDFKELGVKTGFIPGCEVGVMQETIPEDARTSHNKIYRLDLPICEYNTSSELWHEKSNGVPTVGSYISIIDKFTGNETWAFVVGNFNDSKNPSRLLIVSKPVLNSLGYSDNQHIITADLTLLTEEVVLKNQAMQELRREYNN